MKIIIVPDDGREYTLVPKVATDQMAAVYENRNDIYGTPQELHAAMLAAAPPCKVVELPERRDDSSAFTPLEHLGWNECLDEIERRAK